MSDPEEAGLPVPERADGPPAEAGVDAHEPTYYDQPAIKESVWIWSVPAYFYVGGAASGAALLGAAAQLVDRQGLDGLVRRCRTIAFLGTVASTGLLIHDLGRPIRFLNMLRVFRPSSAMSVGSWVLAVNSTAAGAAATLPRLGLRRLADAAGLGSGLMAPALGTYTAVLISDTAVPVWQATRTRTPALFAASGLVAATSALDLFEQDEREALIVRRLGIVAKVADLAASETVEHAADRLERVGRPLHDGASGALWKAAKACVAASLVTSLVPVPAERRRARRRVSALLGTLGSIVTRFAIFHAGNASARDPRATFGQQRAGGGAAEVTGTAGVTGPEGRRAV
jgi:formate-dependent nitrite reductase membrane component NrfD